MADYTLASHKLNRKTHTKIARFSYSEQKFPGLTHNEDLEEKQAIMLY
jgi:hypothetical protein